MYTQFLFMYCRQDNIVYGPDGLSAFSASYQPCGLGKLPSLDEAGRTYLGVQGVASTKSGVFQGAWAVRFSSQADSSR